MRRTYTPNDWYWIVGGDTAQVYSSKSRSYVPVSDPSYIAWLIGHRPTKIVSETELWNVLASVDVALVPVAGASVRKDVQIGNLDMVALTGLFNHENRIRVLESKTPLTVAQFKAGVKALLT